MAEFGLESLSSSQVSRAAALMDEELEAWRTRRLGAFPYLFLHLPVPGARYEKVRIDGVVRDAAILSAIGGQKASDPISEGDRASRPWRRASTRTASAACSGSPSRCRRPKSIGGAFSTASWPAACAACASSPATTTQASRVGIRAARKAVFPGAVWQRCQFHLARNAIHHAPSVTTRKAIGRQLRNVWNATDRASAEAELARIAEGYARSAPKLATWLERTIPEGLAVFSLPEAHWRRMRTANPIERAIQQELKRRTRKIRVFPNEAALERLATAILVEIDEEWVAKDRAYLNMNDRDE